jgi:hypothetical protein
MHTRHKQAALQALFAKASFLGWVALSTSKGLLVHLQFWTVFPDSCKMQLAASFSGSSLTGSSASWLCF